MDTSQPARSPANGSVRSKARSYAIVAGLFLSLLVVALATSWAAVDLVNDTRAYATGEGRYSKAQKMAVLDLYRYAHTGRRQDYDAFLRDIVIPRGDRQARLALSKPSPDANAAAAGFLQGQNHPRDVRGLIQLFRAFSWWQPFAAAVKDWRSADEQVDALIAHGHKLHTLVEQGRRTGPEAAVLLQRIEALDNSITDRENTFSTHMGDAAREATSLVVWGLGISTVLLWGMGIGFATRLFRQQLALDRKLAASERRFRDYAEVASDWYWEMDRNNTITYMSERFYAIIDIPAEQVIGFDAAAMILQAGDDPRHRDECLAAIANHVPFRGLCLRFASRDGSIGYCSISGKPTYDAAGAFLGYRGVGSDITSLMNDAHDLTQAKNRAEVANRAKSEFLANMSHELRTPLNAIMGFSDVISHRMFGNGAVERYANYARDIHDSGSHLLSIINDILDLSKIEAGQGSLDENVAELEAITAEALTLLGDRMTQSGVSLELSLPDPPPRLWVDERKIVQILLNLLSNAFKFTPRGGSVVLAAEVQDDGGLAISVCDTGIGIAPDDLEKVLSPFGQVESAFSRQHHGTGLGLPLAKSFAELHGGTFSIESVENNGTTVTVHLPPRCVVPLSKLAQA